MTKESNRHLRVSQEIQKEIAIILKYKIKDPRINVITTVSGVKLSRDLSYAKIFVMFFRDKNEDKKTIRNSISILQNATGFIRFLLSKTINLRIVPELEFCYDKSWIEGIRISNLLANV